MNIDFTNGVFGQAIPLTYKHFNILIDLPQVKATAEGLLNGTADEKDKIKMPAICWQAHFANCKRNNENAIPNGLCGLDIDDKNLREGDTPDTLWQRIEPHIEDWDVVAVHKSIGGRGLHVVFCCQPGLETIAENQKWMARNIGTGYDASCKEWARCFIIAPKDYWYYVDPEIFNDYNQNY